MREEKPKYEEGDGEGEDDFEPTIDPDQLFKGKKVKDFICYQFNQMKDQKTLEFDWFDQ